MPERRLFYASTFFGAMTLAAAIDEGRFGDGHRTLLVSNNAAIPEITPSLAEVPGFAALSDRFDRIVSWNEILAPLHPSDWKPRSIEVPMLGRLLAARLGRLDQPSRPDQPGSASRSRPRGPRGEVGSVDRHVPPQGLGMVDELVLESVAVPPSRTLAGLIKDCPITVYSDGLMGYGPTRNPLPREISGRITRLLHLDLVPELVPLLLSEYGVPPEIITGSAFLDIVKRVGAEAPDANSGAKIHADAVILGQYLSSLGVLSAEEEIGLHEAMLRGVAARGHRLVLFKSHPTAGRQHARRLRPVARELGVELIVAAETTPAEVYFAAHRPKLVVGCFSTALTTARRFFGLPVASVGGKLVLERLAPYENSNRIPATIADATMPHLAEDGFLTPPSATDVRALVRAVGYCMRDTAHPTLREAAAAYLEAQGTARYFKNRRLEALGLLPQRPRPPADPPKSPKLRTPSRLRRFLSR